jgi:hypothetical protein
MKKIGVVLMMGLFFSVWATAQATAQDLRAVIRDVSGLVEIRSPLSSDWVAAKQGDVLSADTSISTGFKSSALLAVGTSTVIMRPISRLTLRELVRLQGDEQVQLELLAGRIRAEVTPIEGKAVSFTVISPMVTASVRGTAFEFDTINLLVEKGTVRYLGEGSGRAVLVRGGQGSWVDEISGKVASPAAVAAENLAPILPGAAGESGFTAKTPGEIIFTPPVPTGIKVTIEIAE